MESIATTENPTEQINLLDKEFVKARNNQLDVLVPKMFGKAEKSFADARQGRERGDPIAVILENVSLARAQLGSAEGQAEVVHTALAEVIQARKLAREAGATIFDSYAEAEKSFLELTRGIENNNLGWATNNQARVTKTFDQLEVRAIKEQTIGEVRTLIQQAEKEGARDNAPQMYALAEDKLKQADEFISEHRYQKEEMHKKAEAALFQAGRLLQMTRLSKEIKPKKPEEIALWMENILHQAATKLSVLDMRNQPNQVQVDNLLASIKAVHDDRLFMVEKAMTNKAELDAVKKKNTALIDTMRTQYQTEISSLKNQIATLEGKTREDQIARERLAVEINASEQRLAHEKQLADERLAAERRFNEQYNVVQTFFAPEEAEVYKQGSQLVIRLKTMQFPVGKAIIMPNNYAILSKVQRSIRVFAVPEVVIEGHTDSTGSDELNADLSKQRAEAVNAYLVANQTLPPERIVAVGYGSKRPLESNETPEGRAANRRIDVIVTPAAR
ncbi:MAG: OmpA family protein [Proteobacteria bacterium]|nr:OmpA family protein [Pseudomonadota bacterium]MBU1687102.1 OmpA family protein [Pseudomonadota bacterium]